MKNQYNSERIFLSFYNHYLSQNLKQYFIYPFLLVFVPIIIKLIYKSIQLFLLLITLFHISTYSLQLLGKSLNSHNLGLLIFKMGLIVPRGVVIRIN